MRWLIVVAALTVLLTGCGGSVGVSGGAAGLVPADALGFVVLDTHLSANEWTEVGVLLRRFPVQDPLLAELPRLQSMLGGELDLVAVGSSLVALTKPHDRTRLLAKLGGGFSSRQVGEWTVFARNKAALEAIGTGKATLANARSYRLATASLPGGTVARAYASSAATQQLLDALPSQDQVVSAPNPRRRLPGQPISNKIASERFAWGAAGIVASSHGLVLDVHAETEPSALALLETAAYIRVPIPVYPARLVDEIPADALAVADFQVTSGEFEDADRTTLPVPLQTAFAAAPSLSGELDTILGGETVLYVRTVRPVPEVTLVTQPTDTRAAIEALGTALKEVPALRPIRPHVAVLGGELVISTTQHGLDAFRAARVHLSRDPMFNQATRAAGLPARATGFVYADLRQGAAALRILAPLFSVPVAMTSARALLVFDNRVGSEVSSTLFLLGR